MDHAVVIEPIDRELLNGREQLMQLKEMLDQPTVRKHYIEAMRGLCNSGLFGLSLMMVASLVAAALLTILVCVDSHTWIYLSKRYGIYFGGLFDCNRFINKPHSESTSKRLTNDKSETTPFLNSSASTASPTQPQILSGTSTINRTLLHHQQQHHHDAVPMVPTGASAMSAASAGPGRHNNGLSAIRGSAYSGDSPPPDYNIVVHDSRHGFISFSYVLSSFSRVLRAILARLYSLLHIEFDLLVPFELRSFITDSHSLCSCLAFHLNGKMHSKIDYHLTNQLTVIENVPPHRHSAPSGSHHHSTLGRLPSQHMQMHGSGMGPSGGKYATLSKQCKTLESNDFY